MNTPRRYTVATWDATESPLLFVETHPSHRKNWDNKPSVSRGWIALQFVRLGVSSSVVREKPQLLMRVSCPLLSFPIDL